MFTRIRATIQVLSSPKSSHSASEVSARLDRYRRIDAGRSQPDEQYLRNPVVVVIEVALAIVIMLYALHPVVRGVFVSESGTIIGTTLGAIATFQILRSIDKYLAPRVNLGFLDPYFGSRIRRTTQAFKKA